MSDSTGPRLGGRLTLLAVGCLWLGLAAAAAMAHHALQGWSPGWREAFSAAGIWGVNLLVLRFLIGPPFSFSRVPVLTFGFGLAMTILGSGSYWVTTMLFPTYRVPIARAALFVSLCMLATLLGHVALQQVLSRYRDRQAARLEWDWARLAAATTALAVIACVAALVSLRRIGYLPVLEGDPQSARTGFADAAGIWFRISMLAVTGTLLAGALVCARRGGGGAWLLLLVCLGCTAVYGNRFFTALPVGAILVLWDRTRSRLRPTTLFAVAVTGIPVLALLFFWRQRDPSVTVLGGPALVLYGTLGEFRDLAWALDHFGAGDRFLYGSTLPGMVVPLLPAPLWTVVGVDKAAAFAHSSAAVVAEEMGRTTAQRIGLYGELFINFGWYGSLIGAALYGAFLGLLDRWFQRQKDGRSPAAIALALVIASAVYAQVGQWNMFTSTIVLFGYPILAVALLAARWRPSPGPGAPA